MFDNFSDEEYASFVEEMQEIYDEAMEHFAVANTIYVCKLKINDDMDSYSQKKYNTLKKKAYCTIDVLYQIAIMKALIVSGGLKAAYDYLEKVSRGISPFDVFFMNSFFEHASILNVYNYKYPDYPLAWEDVLLYEKGKLDELLDELLKLDFVADCIDEFIESIAILDLIAYCSGEKNCLIKSVLRNITSFAMFFIEECDTEGDYNYGIDKSSCELYTFILGIYEKKINDEELNDFSSKLADAIHELTDEDEE